MPLNPISLDEQERQSKICISYKIHFFNESRSHLVWLHLNITCAFKNAASKTLENVHWNIYSIAYHSVLYIHCVHISILLFHTKSMHQCTHVPFSKSAPLPPKFWGFNRSVTEPSSKDGCKQLSCCVIWCIFFITHNNNTPEHMKNAHAEIAVRSGPQSWREIPFR